MPPKHRRERPRPAVLPMLGALPLLLLLLLLGHFGVSPALGQVARGRLNNWQIREASGLAASRRHSGVLYTHNDSGDRSRVFAINEWGSYLGTFELSGAEARDWEDIAIGPGPVEGRDYLYVGDIGDNRAYYPTKVVYRVMEPNATTDPANQRSEILTGVEKFEFRFPGHAGNANSETLMVDPHTGDLFIVRKTAHHPLQVFWARAPLLGGTVMDLEEYHVTCVDYDRECRDEHHKSPSKGELVGGDISPSGLGLLIKSYRAVYYWRRSSTHESFFQSDPRVVPYAAERQGEAICWDSEEKGYFTLSEGTNQMLYYYPYQPHAKWVDTVNQWKQGFRWNDAIKATGAETSAGGGQAGGWPAGDGSSLERESEAGEGGAPQAPAAAFTWDGVKSSGTRPVEGKLVGNRIVVTDECLDIPSPSGSSCAEEAAAGNCEFPWMTANGFCSKSCGTCRRRLLSKRMEDEVRRRPENQNRSPPSPQTTQAFSESVNVDSWWSQWMRSRSDAGGVKVSSHDNLTFVSGQADGPKCGSGTPSGSYVGPIVMKENVASPEDCCTLCEKVSDRGNKRCDTWSYCKDSEGCGRFERGTCLLKRSITYEFRDTAKWVSGYRRMGGREATDEMVMGVSQGPEGKPIDWPLFFRDYANKTWMESMYYADMAAESAYTDAATLEEEEDWLCQKDLGVLTCPEKGCHALRGHYKGLIVAEIDFPSVARCCEACRHAREHKIPPHNNGCDVWSFCSKSEGCGLMQPFGTCMLKVVSENPQMGLAWSFDPLKPFTSGKIE